VEREREERELVGENICRGFCVMEKNKENKKKRKRKRKKEKGI